jgi:hypothetical protein
LRESTAGQQFKRSRLGLGLGEYHRWSSGVRDPG